MQDTYYQRSEVSNSDLTELKNLLYPRTQYGDKEKAFKFGSLIDAMITEPERVRYDKRMVDDVLYSGEDWELAQAMIKSLRMEARHDPLIKYALEQSDKQKFMVNKNQKFQYGNFEYTLDTRCKWDFWFSAMGFGGDLKTTFASSQKQFNEAIIIRKSKFPQNPKRSVRFSGKRTKRSVQKRKARNTQKAETKVL